jgi:hypothetical protein
MRALAAACLRYFSAWHIANLWQNPHHRAMDHSLPRLTLCLVFLLGAAAGSSRSANSAETAGDQAVAAAARNVQNESALSADLRYRIDAFGHQLAGQGSYQQLGKGPEKLLRLELKIQVADQAITRQEVCGPTFYYIRRESPFAPTSLGRVNLRHVREAIARAPAPIATNPAEVWILLGGLPRLLETLHRNFEFDEPREDALQFTTEGAKDVQSLPVLVVRGRWKKQRLEALQTTSTTPSSLSSAGPTIRSCRSFHIASRICRTRNQRAGKRAGEGRRSAGCSRWNCSTCTAKAISILAASSTIPTGRRWPT